MNEPIVESGHAETPVVLKRDRAVVEIVLNRPRALNALNGEMKSALTDALPPLARNPDIYVLVFRSSTARAFCAGGDVRELAAQARQDIAFARRSLATEYALDWMLDCFPKPSVALLEGAVMGSGVGLSHFCTHRVAAPSYVFAMPETAIGFFPDVGMAHVLAGLPDAIGFYLALTGRTIGRSDAYALGLVTHCIEADAFDGIVAALADAQPIDPLLDTRHVDPGPSELSPHRSTIARAFSRSTVDDIVHELQALHAAGHDADWIDGVLTDLAKRSPTALKVTQRYLRQSALRDLRENLIADYYLACRFLAVGDFHEGVRAVLVDKDGKPQWNPAQLADVTDADIEDLMTWPANGDFTLPPRDYLVLGRA